MIIVIDNHGQFTHLIHRSLRELEVENDLIDNETSVEDIRNVDPSGLILSGGPDINRIGKTKKYIKKIKKPILGICLGHQVIAKEFDGKIGSGKSGGYAEVKTEIISEDELFKGLGQEISVWASHADEVKEAPEDFEILARSKVCEIEAMKHSKKPIFGIQGHPEVSHTPKGKEILKNFISVCDEY
ncbi:MAG: GMP synthase - Glutamine amidotransferase domain [Candidatus Methanohalarchaeum thermophilum]|uniref:GMP synthase [glutamine-hydrolyzing] subunit A n=1 Tax=Methanohalarchaeum thermophilum TaxID=1903181 RepID=A0A1Q6DW81_METT1|nr:MAG: GMP synthase - Glutamine amidotransferase domain [Candidatus Methanohalarchaeum thermophilum]